MLRQQVLSFAETEWGIQPDYPWARTPDSAVLRHPTSGKWFGLIMSVSRKSLGMTGNGITDVLNVKADSLMLPSLLCKQGYLPAYHMNKEHWLTLLLDGSVPLKDICYLLKISHDLTRPVRRTRKSS